MNGPLRPGIERDLRANGEAHLTDIGAARRSASGVRSTSGATKSVAARSHTSPTSRTRVIVLAAECECGSAFT